MQTPLHLAALNGDETLLRILFMAKADPSIRDVQDQTPIYVAAERGHTLAVEFLAERFKVHVRSRELLRNDEKRSSGGFYHQIYSSLRMDHHK